MDTLQWGGCQILNCTDTLSKYKIPSQARICNALDKTQGDLVLKHQDDRTTDNRPELTGS
jgi:hypothetical protein